MSYECIIKSCELKRWYLPILYFCYVSLPRTGATAISRASVVLVQDKAVDELPHLYKGTEFTAYRKFWGCWLFYY